MARTISEQTWLYARSALYDEIALLLDDPYILDEEPERVDELKAIALDLELDINTIIAEAGTPYEIDRIKKWFS